MKIMMIDRNVNDIVENNCNDNVNDIDNDDNIIVIII